MDFPAYLDEHVRTTLNAATQSGAPGAYAVSFFVYDDDDDPMRPTLTIGWNTEERVAFALNARPDQRPHQFWVPEDEAEARWNYAFWLQNRLSRIGDAVADPVGSALRREWITAADRWSDDPWEPGFEAKAHSVTQAFVELCVRTARGLHSDGTIARLFGRAVPVLVHEVEYYDAIADQAAAANPPGVADEFLAWIRQGSEEAAVRLAEFKAAFSQQEPGGR